MIVVDVSFMMGADELSSLDQLQHLLVSVNAEGFDVVVAVVLQPLQEVPVVDHHPTGVVHPPPGGIGHPVNSPETGTVPKVEIGD